MTLKDLRYLGDRSLEARICIIGAGAAGVTLACELDGCGHSVLLIEAGELRGEGRFADYYRGDANAPHPDPSRFRRVAFGGTTGLWGGRCVALDPVDFERREHVPHSGWPISYPELARHYRRAMQYCDAGDCDFTVSGSLCSPAATIEGFDGGELMTADCIERYSLPTDFGKRYRRKLRESENVMAVLGARCLRLVKSAGADRIGAAVLADCAGARRTVHADIFVLATGGIEVPRLLMLSDAEGKGLGNRTDQLGRYYMCHFENLVGRLVPRSAKVVFKFERTDDGVYCRRQFRFSPAALRRYRLLNTVFRLHFPSYSDASHGSAVMSAIYVLKSTLLPEYRAILQQNIYAVQSPAAAHIGNVLRGLPQIAAFGVDWLFRIQLARRKLPYTLVPNADGSFPIELNSEQIPRAVNRVTLGEDTDVHGLRRVRVAWQLSDEEIEAAYSAITLFREVIGRTGVARMEFDTARLRGQLRDSPPLGGHHIGTARMASSERSGVVDENCAVFGIPNLFVASSAVFPTSGHANPTLTIVAVAVRLAAHLRAALRDPVRIAENSSTAAAGAEPGGDLLQPGVER